MVREAAQEEDFGVEVIFVVVVAVGAMFPQAQSEGFRLQSLKNRMQKSELIFRIRNSHGTDNVQ